MGGIAWHQHLQAALKTHGIPCQEISEREVYKFGAGAPITSTTACLYPVRMSIVDKGGANCPGLIGPGELSRWNAIFHFRDKKMELNGVKQEMRLTATRHPGIELVDFDSTATNHLRSSGSQPRQKKRRRFSRTCPSPMPSSPWMEEVKKKKKKS